MRVVCEGDPVTDLLIFAGTDLVFMVTGFWDAVLSASAADTGDEGDEAEPMEVVCYRVK